MCHKLKKISICDTCFIYKLVINNIKNHKSTNYLKNVVHYKTNK